MCLANGKVETMDSDFWGLDPVSKHNRRIYVVAVCLAAVPPKREAAAC
jgi:hypothetical protein